MSVSPPPNWDVLPPRYGSRSKLYKATGGMGGQMEREICVFNQWRGTRGASGGKVRRASGIRGQVQHVEKCQNYRRIWCSS